MTRYMDLIVSSQREEKAKEETNCILRNDLEGYCAHPLIDESALRCNYGLTETKVPRNCPLREKSLTIKLIHRTID